MIERLTPSDIGDWKFVTASGTVYRLKMEETRGWLTR